MNGYLLSRGTVALLGALLAGGAWAQAADERDGPLPSAPGTVLSDAAPLPAEDRDSQGAIVLRQSPVRAQRASAAEDPGAAVRAVDRNVTQVLGGPPAASAPAQARPDARPRP